MDGEKWARARMMAHLYLDGARSFDKVTNAVVSAVASAVTISTDEGRVSLQLSLPDNFRSHTVAVPTTADLGRVRFPDLEFDAHDGSPIQLGTDLLGSVADGPTVAGPIQSLTGGRNCVVAWH